MAYHDVPNGEKSGPFRAALKIKGTNDSETSVNIQQPTWSDVTKN